MTVVDGPEMRTFLDLYLKALVSGQACVFAGAGLSVPAGYVDWRALLKPLAEDVGLDVAKEHDLIRVSQYAINSAGGRARVNQRIIGEFSRTARRVPSHDILARLPIATYWTTNFDTLLEEALRAAGRRPAVVHAQEQLTSREDDADATVYKMHGDKSRPDQCVLSMDDFEQFAETRGQFLELLRGSMAEQTFLFLGYSLTDPNIDLVLAHLRSRFGRDRREHFWLTKRVTREDHDSDEEFHYERGRESLRIQDLKRYGIQTVLMDSYADLETILRRIQLLYRRRFVFISGAAHDYDPLGQDSLETLSRKLGERLIHEGYGLISGGGVSIGTAAVLGAASQSARTTGAARSRLRVTAFDQNIEDAAVRNAVYEQYRKSMLSEAGFAVFIAGNKLQGTETRPAGGIRNEYEIGRDLGVLPIPIGATGHMARTLWDKVRDDPIAVYGDDRATTLLDRLAPGRTDVADMLDAIFEIIYRYDGRRR
ncbi:hypothetical protein Ade02nite_84310 [Paractinoplanes deccanensis]|uniref:NAD(+) hydrolase ThsA n=1 Tax=Paractinoplanes deccanensis TaxID=113561 RepID=A0ABQ3YIF6_9ACTN|nr:SIR2 family protein [Actinoplanes deccanensis]GID79790.1 hypothetical protein Ade02nite_84310 [Actinoplanes deccanensis]